jgi:hypothetical protein
MNNDDVDAIVSIPRPDGLNDRQYAFVQAYARDPNGTRAAIAAGYSEATAHVKASNLLNVGKVRSAVDAIRTEYQRRAVAATLSHQERYSRDWVLRSFEKNAEIGRDTNQLSASNRAIELIAKGVHPGFMDRGDGASVQVLGDLSFTMNIGSASGDEDVDVIDGSSVAIPMVDEPDEPDE